MLKTAGMALASAARSQPNDNSKAEWKSFSIRIRQVKGNFCHYCRRADKITSVHAFTQGKGKKAWECEASDSVVLCEDCHQGLQDQLNAFRRHVFPNLSPGAFRVLNGALSAGLKQYDPLTLVHALAEFVSTPRAIENFSKAWKPK